MRQKTFAIVRLACEIEATAVKAGNVHPQANFVDTSYADFIKSATILEATWQEQVDAPVGVWIYEAVKVVREQIGRNTNLGIILLLAPLAKAALLSSPNDLKLASHEVLSTLNRDDANWVYKAIRLANPGGLGKASKHDVHAQPPACLISAMQLSADYDDIAKQYVTNFADVYEIAQRLALGCDRGYDLLKAVELVQIEWLALHADTLIARKCGSMRAAEVQERAAQVSNTGEPNSQAYLDAWNNFDAFLRSDGNRLNPGTTADLLAAAIFVFLLHHPQHHDTVSIPR